MTSPATLIVPATFVVLWSTGFVTARLVAPHAEPLTFLTIRFVLAAAILAGAALAAGAAWPATARGWRDAAIAGRCCTASIWAGCSGPCRKDCPPASRP
jgi:drug/metabolite transporter (DMT)-like permease